MTFEQALAFWYGRINYELRIPGPGDLKLDRMRALLALLGDPHQGLRVIHVAGSKGKGSTSAMLAAILQRAGYRTGLFTSPHLCRVEERMQVDGTPITPAEMAALMTDVRPAVELLDRHEPGPTFFEIATAVGLLHFVRRRVEVAILEVGLGGRFDATNVCRPLVAVVTSISYDHTQQLGDRLAQIAMEKAGIVKPGRPAISGAVHPEARPVIEAICRQRGAPLRQLGVEIHYTYEPGQVRADGDIKPRVGVRTEQRTWPAMALGLLGEHQAANAAVAVACVEQLRAEGLTIADDAVAGGLADVRWPARLEVVARRPLVVLDCAHNVASAQALVDTLQASFPPGRPLLVFAVSNDKDVAGILHVLAGHFDHFFLTRFRSNPRSTPPEKLAEWLGDRPRTLFQAPEEAWQAARGQAGPNDLICITGSVFLAGELRSLARQ
jgi:dihydrofolate synthase/folylpolyglutamate synthase